MSYTVEEYESARRELEKRKTQAELTQQKHHDEVLLKIPEIKEIESRMAKAGLSAVKALGMGKDGVGYIKQLETESLAAQSKRAELLVKNGYPEDYLKTKYSCPLCSDTGFVNGKMCGCHKLILRNSAYEKLNSVFPLHKFRFDNFDVNYHSDSGEGITHRERMRNILEFCKRYADDFGTSSQSIVMQGDTGLGKTHLSLAIAGAVIKKGYGVVYSSAQNIISRLENEKFGRSENIQTEKNILECDLLILDDLGTEFVTQFSVSAIYNIINSRQLSSKPTIISTNLSMKQIQDIYTPRTASRVLSEFRLLRFYGTDVRQKKLR